MNLNQKIEDFFISKNQIEELKLIGINSLKDFNYYNLTDLNSFLTKKTFFKIIPILKKYFLPNSLENLGFDREIQTILKQKGITDNFSFLKTEPNILFNLFKNNNNHYEQINTILNLYNDDDKKLNSKENNFQNNKIMSEEKKYDSKKEYGSREYDYFKIRLASPNEIKQWSYGEVVNYETINYRTAKPEIGGLFCPRIFGPTKDLQCFCTKKQTLQKNTICPKCEVELTEQKVRRERMGHIELCSPIVHSWYANSSPSRIAILLGIKAKELTEIIYYASYIVMNPGSTNLKKDQIISELEYSYYLEKYGDNFNALTGAEAIKKLLKDLDLNKTIKELRNLLNNVSKQKRINVIRRLEIIESFHKSDNKPEWMVMDVIPVLPADLRPIVPLDGGRFATTDINDLYRRILNRNNRLKKQIKQKAPRLIIKNEKRMLQEAVDSLFDNVKMNKKNNSNLERNRPLKSLSEMLRGKQGRFRQNLLGKRVDYSARSVIIVGPELKIHECGIPKEMAVILFKPFILNKLQKVKGIDKKSAILLYEKMNDYVWTVLEEVVKEHPILLNRAPTLHRLGMQCFSIKVVQGKSIKLHPLVTPAFNADFDGDQMAVYLPLSLEAQAEARLLMLSSNNILDPKNGNPVLTPSQDMVLGNYYLTIEEKRDRTLTGFNAEEKNIIHKQKHRNEGKIFSDLKEAELAFFHKEIALHTRILVQPKNINSYFTEEQKEKYLITTLGKLIFNQILPSDFPYIQEPTAFNLENKTPDIYFISKGINPREKLDKAEYIEPFKKKFLSMIITLVFKKNNNTKTAEILDNIKDLGFKYSTMSGITISYSDINIYSKKEELLELVENKILEIDKWYDSGLLTSSEKKGLIIQEWKNVRDEIQEGLTVAEFFLSVHGTRKVSIDLALKTAESGYLTRRLVDVAQDNIITKNDCFSDKYFTVEKIKRDDKEIISLEQRIFGRYSAENIFDPITKDLIIEKNQLITRSISKKICESLITKVKIRSVLTCNCEHGICVKCYGLNLATNKDVEIGEAVGVIAAQSIGEPGTQLTMRTFHTGGVLSVSDITQGLPRIQELLEARKPKGQAIISEYDGIITKIKNINSNSFEIFISPDTDVKKEISYITYPNTEILVKENMNVKSGQKLTNGSIDIKELLRTSNTQETQKYILEEVQKVYQSQSVTISDKHIEIIVRQMFKQIMVISSGDTNLLPGLEISAKEFKKANDKMIRKNKNLAVGKPILLGITRASLKSDSFLSAASFQETTKILIDAAIKGQKDPLYGLKENVIVGGLIPAGTGILDSILFKYPKKIKKNKI
ncbi:DNA-directed RNA polymerase subunit beta' [Texas Phoenix palm phytoplasma]|uniref:DNA-directed RNA polymerase subunit beta' n=1 Tax=Texas Phoenix palm phytoplasma TaxID=176709 RepID=A0ABS5BIF2_9MOLU|nr:DNA-directed RNA polymerase subunit beta' [Texas Phoenix palm phytoplasma]MBP3059324.1 DNA-directed RNA polymerase subunit beta' [Texas Phoenix palm phytoplasma]